MSGWRHRQALLDCLGRLVPRRSRAEALEQGACGAENASLDRRGTLYPTRSIVAAQKLGFYICARSSFPDREPVAELPEITAYVRALEQRILGQVVETVRIRTPSLLRTFDPRVSELEGRRLTSVRRVGKTNRLRVGGGIFRYHPPHDRRPPVVEEEGCHHSEEAWSRGVRFSQRNPPADGSEHTQEGVAPRGPW